ncbi:hypothetical protein [Mesorhizobium sp. ES1-4]|uniref:hypothetical protein n=1 Tax=Mesorhizobium sp. ES1-4 TaxID=2876627 RepID=UPI001CCD62F6|nr:hypothetical protein [Mesorhizobium sp. ES1-4]MBZ9799354.1 hypothetical protein [Mesorhizobium sp. ES1-4]
MSGGGGGGGRDDLGPVVDDGFDQCSRSYEAPINSPKPSVLGPLNVGDVLDVLVVPTGSSSTLAVMDSKGSIGGSLTFFGYLQVINCIVQQAVTYKAEILSIAGGVFIVRVAPV